MSSSSKFLPGRYSSGNAKCSLRFLMEFSTLISIRCIVVANGTRWAKSLRVLSFLECRPVPFAAKKPCAWAGCTVLVSGGSYCPKHAAAAQARREASRVEQDRRRGSSTQRGYDYAWQQLRVAYLKAHPQCEVCQRETPYPLMATIVDHKTPHHNDDALRLAWSNLQALCKGHHDAKTASQDGGFGNPRRRPEGER